MKDLFVTQETLDNWYDCAYTVELYVVNSDQTNLTVYISL